MFIITWLLNHAIDIMAVLWILDQITAATPKTWKIGNFPIGKYDNLAVSFAKGLMKKIIENFGKGQEENGRNEGN